MAERWMIAILQRGPKSKGEDAAAMDLPSVSLPRSNKVVNCSAQTPLWQSLLMPDLRAEPILLDAAQVPVAGAFMPA